MGCLEVSEAGNDSIDQWEGSVLTNLRLLNQIQLDFFLVLNFSVIS